MKKAWIFMTIIAMMLSATACRPKEESGAAGEGAQGQPASVTEQDGQAIRGLDDAYDATVACHAGIGIDRGARDLARIHDPGPVHLVEPRRFGRQRCAQQCAIAGDQTRIVPDMHPEIQTASAFAVSIRRSAESAVAWTMAVERKDGPVCLIMSRQNLNQQARTAEQLEAVRRGGYILKDCEGAPELRCRDRGPAHQSA